MEYPLKLLIVGDQEVGKNSLFNTYISNHFSLHSSPVPNVAHDIIVTDKKYVVAVFVSYSQDYDRLRPMSYPGRDCILLCYSVENRSSFENLKKKWFPRLTFYYPGAARVVVACKTDLRATSPHSREMMVCYEEGFALAQSFNASFHETSSLTREGLDECIQHAVEIADLNRQEKKKPQGLLSEILRKPLLIPPVKPRVAKAPEIKIETSTFGHDWYSALQDQQFHDVTFIVEGKRHLYAHRIVLCAASPLLSKLLTGTLTGPKTQEYDLSSIDGFSNEVNSGKIEGISAVYDKDESDRLHVVIELSANIQAKTFVRVLEFLYTGLPRLSDDVNEAELNELKRVANIFKLSYLATICTNVIIEEEFFNPVIGNRQNKDTASKMKQMFFNKESMFPDVVFNVEGSKVYAHKIVLCTRSRVMAAMFSGNFMEGSSLSEININGMSLENFLALLEYLYTDHFPIEQISDVVGLLILADEKGVHRLVNLCELYISKEVERVCGEKQIEKADVDVIGLLNMARMVNANQLAEWCLHFVSTNYVPFSKCKKFSQLTSEDRSYVDEHRWPPLSYLQDEEKFEKKKKKLAEHGHKCSLM